MATKRTRPLRTLTIFLLVIAAMYGGMAALHAWTPKLGLDLRGGTTITLTAKNDDGSSRAPSAENLQLTRQIIERRVNALGVGETSVTTSGDRQIQVAVPNVQQDELVRLVGTTAKLGFRQVLTIYPNQVPQGQEQGQPQATGTPAATATASTTPAPSGATPSSTPAPSGATPSSTPSPTGHPRPLPGLPTVPPTAAPAVGNPSIKPTPRPTAPSGKQTSLAERLAYKPTAQDMAELASFQCDAPFPDVADQPLISCDTTKTMKYLLGPVLIDGKEVGGANAGQRQNDISWVVTLSFKDQGAKDFGQATAAVSRLPEASPQTMNSNMIAIVLDGKVISAPRINEPITGGNAEISGSFTQKSSMELANVLKFGALPVALETSSVDTVSATLGSDQLKAGIIAGVVGLLLVVAYALLYYRGLALVVSASLAVAGVMTWAVLTLLGQSLDLALNLPGIAGAIVAIGVTADSFIVYFERIRDEVREGRSLRTAIETGWRKARGTILMADGVSLLSALILFMLAIGAVKGFAFTLGVTTLIDLAIIFWFTKPMMTLLGRTKFFGAGHKFSGLEAEHMGVDHLNTGRATRRATTKEA